MSKLQLTTYKESYDLAWKCSIVVENSNLIVVRDDGSIYKKSFKKSANQAVELFGPIEREINIRGSIEGYFNSYSFANCEFPDRNTVVIYDYKKGEYILRLIKERKQFILQAKDLLKDEFLFISSLGAMNLIDYFDHHLFYPYFIQPSTEEGTQVYHIPSGQIQKMNNISFELTSKDGRFALEKVKSSAEEDFFIQAVFYPFDPSKRSVILKMKNSEFEYIDANIDQSLFFISTALGEIFIIDMNEMHIKKLFAGQQIIDVQVSDSGNILLLDYWDRNRDYSYNQVHKIRESCVEPVSVFSENIEEKLIYYTKLKDPAESSLLAFLTGILQKEKLVKKHSQLIQPLLWRIFLQYPSLYLDLHFRSPILKSLPPFPTSFITDENIQSKAKKSLRFVFEQQTQFRYTSFSNWNFIHSLKFLFSFLTDQEKNLYMEKITESISNGATAGTSLFQDVFQSKLYYIIYSHVKLWFGEEYKPVSDITVVRNKNSFQTVILSSEPISNQTSIETKFGVHYAIVEDLSWNLVWEQVFNEIEGGMELVNHSTEWSLPQGPSYRAHIKANVQDQYQKKKYLIEKKAGPDYESIWMDGTMSGLIIVGSSLRSFSETLLENYLSYFKEQGFEFSEVEVPDFKPFLMERIGNCEVDYFLKESHSDGDERNVFRFDHANAVLKGVRLIEGYEEEIVYIAFPKPFHFGKRKTELFSNQELAELIKKREQKGCGELTYFNTSCWSHVKARYELEAVNSPLFLNIPSMSLSDTFLNREGEAIRELLHSYRLGLDFDEFRSALMKNKGYKSGAINDYIFPDERRYNDSIFDHISIPLKIEIDLERKEGEKWISISPDEAL